MRARRVMTRAPTAVSHARARRRHTCVRARVRGGGRASHFTAAVTAALERTRRNAPAELVHDVGRNATVLVVVDAAVTAVVVPVDRRLTRLEIKGVLGGVWSRETPKT